MKNIFPDPVKEPVLSKKVKSRKVTEIKLECGHLLMAINPIGDSPVCHFCSCPRDRGLMKLERRWTSKKLEKS